MENSAASTAVIKPRATWRNETRTAPFIDGLIASSIRPTVDPVEVGAFLPTACVVDHMQATIGESLSAAVEALQLRALQSRATSIQATEEAVANSLSHAYFLESTGRSREAAQSLMVFVDASLRAEALASCNKLLAQADLQQLSSRSMVGLVRSTLRASGKLPAWDATFRRSVKQLRSAGKSPDQLFIGMNLPQEVEGA